MVIFRYVQFCDVKKCSTTCPIIIKHDVENEQLKKENEKLRKEESEKLRNENEQLRKNNVVKDATIKESIETKSLEENKNATDSYPNWFDKNKYKSILAITDSNKFNYRHKIMNSSILTLNIWLIILVKIQLVKYLLKIFQ